MRHASWMAMVCSFAVSGCLFGGGSGSGGDDDDDGADSSAGDVDDGGDVADDAGDDGSVPYAELQSCRGDATDEEVIETVAITDAYSESLHEMIACGLLSVRLCTAIVEGIVEAIQAGSNNALPDGWTFDAGIYRATGNGVVMEAQFFLAQDTSFGQAGDPIQQNLFLVDSYLVDAELVVDVFEGTSEIRYDAPGPLVELLGFGANPPNPLPVGLDDLADIQDRLRALDFETTIVLDDVREKGTIRYDIETPRMSAGALLGGNPLVFGLIQADGERAALEQALVVDLWDVEFVQHGSLDGEVQFHVDGNHFPFRGVMRWDDSPFPDRELSCP